ncbi:cardiolipin synthase [Pontibacillus yanchengensis]|uniref:Cardiolipin synthase n=1 Tax=Pontibacillus yanchengensis Y32 TaxID=1385514 RepID=A0A0A2TCH9_9BACI|nr:cardiolipin synthase [Pontibacillus yanchengensis]KGP73244.1 phospholipase D [Pontibacillus yanchengensis Y32]
MGLLAGLAIFVTFVNVLLGITIIFLERKQVSTTWAWLMVLFFIPIFGFILYLFLGQNLSKAKLFRVSSEASEFFTSLKQRQKKLFDHHHESNYEYQGLMYMNLVNNDSIFSNDNHVEVFTDGHKKMDDLIREIEGAKEFIHIQYYIVRNDDTGQRLINALTKKAYEGVEVRFLYDDMGSLSLRRSALAPLIKAGGHVAAFFPSRIPYINLRLNYRNHRKIAVVDGVIGYIGGFNIGNEYLGMVRKFGYWRDTHLKVNGSTVYSLQTRFYLDWNHASKYKMAPSPKYFPDIQPQGNSGMQIITSGPDSEWQQIKNAYIKLILSAKESVYIQTPYFIPDDSLMDAIKIASLSGVDVKIMIPNKPDHMFVYWATYAHIGQLIDAGVRSFTYENGFLHAKTLVVDGKVASVGTANIDVRSFKLNFEVNAIVYDPILSNELQQIFIEDLAHSYEITEEVYRNRTNLIKIKESVSRLLSPIL